jgi:hypothetical protein
MVLGYPGLVENDYLVRAIVRQGIVAWTNPNRPSDNVFLVDANLYLGNSGGPVLKLPFGIDSKGGWKFLGSGNISLLGIVSKVPNQKINVMSTSRAGSVQTQVEVAGIGGLGVIEPVSKISKLLAMIRGGTVKPAACDMGTAQGAKNVAAMPAANRKAKHK